MPVLPLKSGLGTFLSVGQGKLKENDFPHRYSNCSFVKERATIEDDLRLFTTDDERLIVSVS